MKTHRLKMPPILYLKLDNLIRGWKNKVLRTNYGQNDLKIIQSIIEQAAQASLIHFFQQSTASYKSDGSIVTNADLAMQESLATDLDKAYPQVAMLSEEITEAQQVQAMTSGQDYWCLDPLDGTTNYQATMPLFSVSLALVSAGQVVLAVIYDPIRHEFFSAVRDQGFFINGNPAKRPIQPTELSRSVAFIDFKRLPVELRKSLVDHSPYKSQRNIGSCALEWAWLAAGRAQLLIHGSEKLWDYAAGCLLLSEAGGISETIPGEAVFVESLETRSVVATSNAELFDQWSNRIRQF